MDLSLRTVRPHIVQSIRAFRPHDLQAAATHLGQHFLHANLGAAQTKQDVLDILTTQFTFPAHFAKSFDTFHDAMTDSLHKAGMQPGFVVVLEQLPANAKFDKEAREQLLDIFRDVADYWADRKVPFRCFYSFAVARTAAAPQADGSTEAQTEGEEALPTDKLTDVSAFALRMSSPFNAGYWLAAA